MPIIAAVCTKCGAELKVDSIHDIVVCEYCNTHFVARKINDNNINREPAVAKFAGIFPQAGGNAQKNLYPFVINNGILKKYIGQSPHVVIPDEVSVIGQVAFADYAYLKSLHFPRRVAGIEADAFRNCKSLE